jgi:hypothetical protein
MASFCLGTHRVSAQVAAYPMPVGTQVSPSVEQIADAFLASSRVSYWRGYYYYYFTGVTNNSSTNISANFTLQLVNGRWGFTQMNINGTELPIDLAHPMWEVPAYVKGSVHDFQFSLQGYDKNGQNVRYGFFYAPVLALSDDITVTIYLNYVQTRIPATLSGDHNSQNTTLVSDDGRYSGWYDPSTGSFYAYYDPISPPKSWLIIDQRNNGVIGSIPFKGKSGSASPDSGNGFVIVNEGDFPELIADSNGTVTDSRSGLMMNHTVLRNGTNYAGKVTIARIAKASDYFTVFVQNVRVGSVAQVYGIDANGVMQHVGDWTMAAGQYQLVVPNVTGYTDYKVIVIGGPSDPVSGFGITIYDLLYQLNFGDGSGGGGKG